MNEFLADAQELKYISEVWNGTQSSHLKRQTNGKQYSSVQSKQAKSIQETS